jgi:hypothetical protein
MEGVSPSDRLRRFDIGPSSTTCFPRRPGEYDNIVGQKCLCGLHAPSTRALDVPVKTLLDCLRRIVDNAMRA